MLNSYTLEWVKEKYTNNLLIKYLSAFYEYFLGNLKTMEMVAAIPIRMG